VRVLQCIDTLRGGGAERQLTYLVEGLLRLDHEVAVVYLVGGTHEPRLAASGATLHRLGMRGTVPLVADLYDVVRRRRIDVVQTWLGRMCVAGGIASRLARRPWLYSERSAQLNERGWRASVRRLVAGGAHAIVANSEAGAEPWRARLGSRVHVVENGVEVDAIAATPAADRRTLDIAADAELIVYAGRFAPPKNIQLLAEALTLVLHERPRAVALALGEGEELDRFRAIVAAAGLAHRCRTPGYRGDLWALLKAADVAIAPSRFEGRPNVVLEAMAAGCPLVASDIAPHRECLPRAAALWFSPASATEAAAALVRVLDDVSSAQARARVARAAVCGQSIDAMSRAYAELYDRLRAAPASGR
jgi:glycosyltransferase involved in cell wall biosynthesis